MPNASNVQTDFRGGEWSKSAQGRMDDPEYARAMNVCYNGYPLQGGSWVRRPSFRQIGYTRKGAPARLRSLASKTRTHYNIEFSQEHLRFVHGAQFVTDASQQKVTAISTDKPALVTTETAHGWVSGDCVIFDFDNAIEAIAAALITARVFEIEYVDPTSFKLHDMISGEGFDGSRITFAAAFSAHVSKITDVTTPYAGETWRKINRVQTDKEVLLLSASYWPRVLTYTEVDDAVWADPKIARASLKDGPYLDAVKGSTVTPSALSGIVSLAFSFTAWDLTKAYDEGDYATSGGKHWKSLRDENVNQVPAEGSAYWQRVSALNFLTQKSFSESDIGRHVRLYSEPLDYATASTYIDGQVVKYNKQYWMAISAIAAGGGSQAPGSDPTKWVIATNKALWTWGKITSISAASKATVGALVGDLTVGPGLAALFNGVTVGNDNVSPRKAAAQGYAGTGPVAATAIASARAWPSKNTRFGGAYTFASRENASVILNLRAKHTAPGGPSDGTLLGTSGTLPYTAITAAPVTITSADATTLWEYFWIEIIVMPVAHDPHVTTTVCASEIEFYDTSTIGNGVSVQILGDPLLYTNPITNWRLGRYNDTDPVYPVCGCYHQGRVYLAAGPNHWDASKSGDVFNFAPTEADGTVTEASAISYTFNTKTKAAIKWMHPGDQGIVCGTTAGEGLIFSTANNEAITPINANFEMRTFFGVSDIEPEQASLSSLFVHANGRDVHEYIRDAYSGRMTGPVLTEFAQGLTKSGLAEIAYQRALTPILWSCREDGGLVGTTYDRSNLLTEHPPKFNGWHRHEHGAPRDFVSVSVGPSVDGTQEALAVVTRDRGTELHRIEVAGDLMPENNDIFDCNFLDGMYVPASGGVTIVATDALDEEAGTTPPPPPPPPDDVADPFSCLGALSPGFYRSETDGVTVVPRTDGHTYLNPYVFGTPPSSVLYEWNGITGVGGHGTQIGKYFAIGWDAHVGDTAFLDLAGNRIPSPFTGSVAIFVITGITGSPDSSTIVSCRVVERWDTCLGTAGSYGALVPKPTWPGAP